MSEQPQVPIFSVCDLTFYWDIRKGPKRWFYKVNMLFWHIHGVFPNSKLLLISGSFREQRSNERFWTRQRKSLWFVAAANLFLLFLCGITPGEEGSFWWEIYAKASGELKRRFLLIKNSIRSVSPGKDICRNIGINMYFAYVNRSSSYIFSLLPKLYSIIIAACKTSLLTFPSNTESNFFTLKRVLPIDLF